MSIVKKCSNCNTNFQCGATNAAVPCWCSHYPALFTPDPQQSCLCTDCLHKATQAKVDQYVTSMTVEGVLHNNIAKDLPKTTHYLEGIDYYTENSYWVFTAWHHLKRGYCCRSGCRHCPYGFKKDAV